MEKDTKVKQAEINHPLFKLAIPLAFSLAGIVICTFTRKSTARQKPPQEQHQMDYPESMSQYEFEDEDEKEEEDEEEDDEDDDDNYDDGVEKREMKDGNAEEEERPQTSAHLSETSKEISIEQCHKESDSGKQMEGVRCLIASVEDRQRVVEEQFYDYCNMKEQESAFQKLQIMCLGLKLEALESQNQKLEGTVVEFREAMEQVTLMRAEIKLLRRRTNRLARANREYSSLMKCYVSKLQAKEEMSRSDQELHLATKEIKEVADQLHKEIKAVEEKLETRPSEIEDMTKLDNTKMFEQLQQLRDRWSSEMEELIYVGWINACLRREILVIEEEKGEEEGDDNDIEEEMKAVPNLRGEVVMELPDDGHVKNCSIEFYGMSSPSKVADIEDDTCTSIVAAKSPGRSLRKPRLLRKLKGWATGKGKCKKACGSGKSLDGWHCSGS